MIGNRLPHPPADLDKHPPAKLGRRIQREALLFSRVLYKFPPAVRPGPRFFPSLSMLPIACVVSSTLMDHSSRRRHLETLETPSPHIHFPNDHIQRPETHICTSNTSPTAG